MPKPETEAMRKKFKVEKFGSISNKSIRRAQQLLESEELSFLGQWRFNKSSVEAMNAKLLEGGVVLIDGFLTTSVAKLLHGEMLGLADEGKFQTKRPFLNQTGINLKAYEAAQSLSEKCRIGAEKFEFRMHEWDVKERPTSMPGALQVAEGMMSDAWSEVLNLLLRGSGMSLPGKPQDSVDRAWRRPPTFRDFQSADYQLTHDDQSNPELLKPLSITYWLSTPGWKEQWGGNFLWCGPSVVASGTKEEAYPNAERILPLFNRAVIFLPTYKTKHAVELVKKPKRSHHRFGFTTFLRLPDVDREGHIAAIMKRQEITGLKTLLKLEL